MKNNVAKIVLFILITVIGLFLINNSIARRQCEESTYKQLPIERYDEITEQPYSSSEHINAVQLIVEQPVIRRIKTQEMNVPNKDSTFKAYMDYRTITDVTTKQWELQQIAYTDCQGLRCIDGYYCVAMGSFYINELGDKFLITLEDDTTIAVIAADYKADIHTNATNQYVQLENGDINIIEFIVDEDVLDAEIAHKGSIHYYENFSGNIMKIERIIE